MRHIGRIFFAAILALLGASPGQWALAHAPDGAIQAKAATNARSLPDNDAMRLRVADESSRPQAQPERRPPQSIGQGRMTPLMVVCIMLFMGAFGYIALILSSSFVVSRKIKHIAYAAGVAVVTYWLLMSDLAGALRRERNQPGPSGAEINSPH